jgi:hypothetical protein
MKKETWAQISKRKLASYPQCKICGIRTATQLHHGIEWRMKKFKKWLDVEENGIELCNTCHATAQNYETAQLVWEVNLARYGAERMTNFVQGLPMKAVPAWLLEKAKELIE